MKNDGFREMNDELLEFLVLAIEDGELSLFIRRKIWFSREKTVK